MNINMNIKKTLTLFLLTSAFSTSLLFAQGRGTPPSPAEIAQRQVNRLTRQLGLTAAQQTDALAIFTKAATDSGTLLGGLRTAHQSLRTSIQNNDLNGINQASTTIGNLTAQLTTADALAEAAFYRILTPDQQAKVNERRGGGPGGFGGGPGGFGGGPGPGPGRGGFRGDR